MGETLERIRTRRSCRTFDGAPLTSGERGAIQAAIDALPPGPFGGQVRIRLLDAGEASWLSTEKLGTYGVIRHAPAYLAGCVAEGERALEDFGAVFERLVLEASALGLGTCWLGGTFRREAFGRALDLEPEEIIPAVSPLGRPQPRRRTLVDAAMRLMAGSDRRKAAGELFFDERWGRPLAMATVAAAGGRDWTPALEAVRLAPSASNNQPWRVVRTAATDRGGSEQLHLFLLRTPGYARWLPHDLQLVDLGIAMTHFELVARESGLPGRWQALARPPLVGPLPERASYRVSWIVD